MHDPTCLICGNTKDPALSWQDYCSLCATQTWGPAVIVSFMRQLANCQEQLGEAKAMLRLLHKG
jgi:hypothetical protein